jgi:hypothetical protein
MTYDASITLHGEQVVACYATRRSGMDTREYARVKMEFLADTFGDIALGDAMLVAEAIEDYSKSETAINPSPAASPLMRAAKLSEANTAAVVDLDELLKTAKQLPSLGAYIREKAHRLDLVRYRPAIHEHGQISRDYWSRLLNDEVKASKEKLLRVAVLLELDAEEAEEMMELAGYSISPKILRDVVVMYCLRKKLYDFVVIEQLLEDHEVQSLFNDRRGT